MEEEGIVSIWLGNFEDKEALAAYAEARFQKDEDGNTVPSFTQDFFNGDLWPFEPDVFDYEMTTASQDPATVAEPWARPWPLPWRSCTPRASTSPTTRSSRSTTISSRGAVTSPARRCASSPPSPTWTAEPAPSPRPSQASAPGAVLFLKRSSDRKYPPLPIVSIMSALQRS